MKESGQVMTLLFLFCYFLAFFSFSYTFWVVMGVRALWKRRLL